jgi:hypothetical protein
MVTLSGGMLVPAQLASSGNEKQAHAHTPALALGESAAMACQEPRLREMGHRP